MITGRIARAVALVALTLIVAVAAAGCGSSASSSSAGASGAATTTSGSAQVSHAKTKFVLHAGLAFGAFHRYIYKPFRAGYFAHPFLHKLTLVKAALAGTFVYHELKLALADAQASPTLAKLVAPVTALQTKLHGLSSDVKSGNAGAVTQDNGAIGSISHLASGAGQPVSDLLPAHL